MKKVFTILVLGIFIFLALNNTTEIKAMAMSNKEINAIRYKLVNTGTYDTHIITKDGSLLSWGKGLISDGRKIKPGFFIPLKGVKSVDTFGWHNIAVTKDGTVWTWGMDKLGIIASKNLTKKPSQVKGIKDAVMVKTGYVHNLVLKKDGTVWAWGLNQYGQLGDGNFEKSSIPFKKGGIPNLRFIEILGDEGYSTKRKTPVKVEGLKDIVYIDADSYTSVALKKDGTVWIWGQLFSYFFPEYAPYAVYIVKPYQIKEFKNIIKVVLDYNTVYGLKSDGTVWKWSCVTHPSDYDYRVSFEQIKGLSNVRDIAASSGSLFAIKNDGTVWAQGQNDEGQLGIGIKGRDNFDKMIIKNPIQIKKLTNIISIDTREGHTIALRKDGTLWVWGKNSSGELGFGSDGSDRYNRIEPVQLPGIKVSIPK